MISQEIHLEIHHSSQGGYTMSKNTQLTNDFLKEGANTEEPVNPFVVLPVPSDFADKTISELIKENNTEFTYQNGNFAIRKTTQDSILTINYTHFSNGGQELKATNHPCQNEKKDNLPFIKEMINKGKSQKEIAFELGLSPSYVSRLLKK